MVEGLEDEEEEQLLRDNQDLVPLFTRHLDELIRKQQQQEDDVDTRASTQLVATENLAQPGEKDQHLEEFQHLNIWLEE